MSAQLPRDVDPIADDDRDDGPDAAGVAMIATAVMLIFWAGAVVGFITALQVRLP